MGTKVGEGGVSSQNVVSSLISHISWMLFLFWTWLAIGRTGLAVHFIADVLGSEVIRLTSQELLAALLGARPILTGPTSQNGQSVVVSKVQVYEECKSNS